MLRYQHRPVVSIAKTVGDPLPPTVITCQSFSSATRQRAWPCQVSAEDIGRVTDDQCRGPRSDCTVAVWSLTIDGLQVSAGHTSVVETFQDDLSRDISAVILNVEEWRCGTGRSQEGEPLCANQRTKAASALQPHSMSDRGI